MKKIFFILFILFSSRLFSNNSIQNWHGEWKDNQQIIISISEDIPFYSDLTNDLLVIHNAKPDRLINYVLLDEYGNALITGSVSKENSAQITISISDLPDNGIFTVILTSPNPNDRVWSQFER